MWGSLYSKQCAHSLLSYLFQSNSPFPYIYILFMPFSFSLFRQLQTCNKKGKNDMYQFSYCQFLSMRYLNCILHFVVHEALESPQ